MRHGGLLDNGDDDYDDDHDEAGGTLWPSPAYDAFEIAAAPPPPHGGGDTAHDTHGGGQAKPGLASFHSIPVSGAPLPPRVPPPHPVDSGGAVKMAASNKRTRADEEAATATVALPVELVGGATLPNLEGDEEELRRRKTAAVEKVTAEQYGLAVLNSADGALEAALAAVAAAEQALEAALQTADEAANKVEESLLAIEEQSEGESGAGAARSE